MTFKKLCKETRTHSSMQSQNKLRTFKTFKRSSILRVNPLPTKSMKKAKKCKNESVCLTRICLKTFKILSAGSTKVS